MKYAYYVHFLNLMLLIAFVAIGLKVSMFIGTIGITYCWLHLAIREDLLIDTMEEFMSLPSFNNPFLSILIPAAYIYYMCVCVVKGFKKWLRK